MLRSLQSFDGRSLFGLPLYLQISLSLFAHTDKRMIASRIAHLLVISHHLLLANGSYSLGSALFAHSTHFSHLSSNSASSKNGSLTKISLGLFFIRLTFQADKNISVLQAHSHSFSLSIIVFYNMKCLKKEFHMCIQLFKAHCFLFRLTVTNSN